MGLFEFGFLLVLGAMWGTAFAFIRIASPEFGPVALVAVRITLAASIVLAYARLSGHAMPSLRDWRKWLVVGAINTALPFFLFSYAELRVTSSLASVMNSTTPLWGAVLAATWLRQSLPARRVAGLAAGFAGVMLVVGWDAGLRDAADYVSALAALGGGASYAVGTLLVRRLFPMAASVTLAVGQLVGAAVIMAPAGVLFWPATNPSPLAWASAIVLAVFLTAVAYVIFFWLVARSGPLAAMSVTFLLPVFGVTWGALLLAEPLSVMQGVGLAIILASVAVVNDVRFGALVPPLRRRPA